MSDLGSWLKEFKNEMWEFTRCPYHKRYFKRKCKLCDVALSTIALLRNLKKIINVG